MALRGRMCLGGLFEVMNAFCMKTVVVVLWLCMSFKAHKSIYLNGILLY